MKRERQIQPVTSSLSVLHCLEHKDSQSWVEKRRGREETDNLVEKKESPKEERMVKPVITSLCALLSLDCLEMFTDLYREEEREDVDRGGQEDTRGK